MELERQQTEFEQFLESHTENLLRVFQYYCSFGDPMNTSKLKNSKFVKIFQDANLVSEVKQISTTPKSATRVSSRP